MMVPACAYRLPSVIQEERLLYRNAVKSVLIVPFLDMTEIEVNTHTITDLFVSELARFRELYIMHPSSIESYLTEQGITLTEKNITHEARRMGTFFNVDAVIIGTITEYNSYPPPVFGLSFIVLNVKTGTSLDSRTVVYDSSFNYVRNELASYASTKKLGDSLYDKDIILQKMDLYIRFVCHQIIKKYL